MKRSIINLSKLESGGTVLPIEGPCSASPADGGGLAPQLQRVAIVEPADAWRHWLERAVVPAASVHTYSTAQSLITALQSAHYDLLIVAFRMRDLDGYGWTRLLRHSPGGQGACIISCVGADDAGGRSLAMLAGADEVYRKVVDADVLSARIGAHLKASVAHAVVRPCALRRQPVFSVEHMRSSTGDNVVDSRILVFDFLDAMVAHAESLGRLYAMTMAPLAQMQQFAWTAKRAGALRLAGYTESMVCELRAGGWLHPELRNEYVSLMAETGRELATWLLERSASNG